MVYAVIFVFQAEDGIRDVAVTGVQTCALPISCAICADTVAVSQFLLTDQRAAAVLPDPDFLWWKAQLASKQMAVERATRSISLVRKVSYWSVAAAGLWIEIGRAHV